MAVDLPIENLSTSSDLVARVKQHDPAAWQRLVDLYSPLVYRWCRWTKLPAQESADVMQSVFLAVFRNIGQFRHDRPHDSLRAWLYTITRNAASDRIAELRRQPQALGGEEFVRELQHLPAAPDESVASPEMVTQLYRRALNFIQQEFEERTWRAAVALVEGRAVADVAAELGMTLAAVRNAKYKVLRRLREELGEA